MVLGLTTLNGNARSALDCGSKAAALKSVQKGGSWRYRTPGAFGTAVLTAGCHAVRADPLTRPAPTSIRRR